MFHLVISCSSYLLFFLAKAMMPTQKASWRAQQANQGQFARNGR